MAYNYNKLIATALRLIDKFGQTVEWRQHLTTKPDPTKPWIVADDAPTIYKPRMVILPIEKDDQVFLRQINGTEAKIGDMYGLIGRVTAFDPTAGQNTIKDANGAILTVLNTDKLAPSGVPLLYTVIFNG